MVSSASDIRLQTTGIRDEEGKSILLDIEWLDKRITLMCNVYAPSSGDHPDFLTFFWEAVSMDNEMIIIGGDWNVALELKIYTNHTSNVHRTRIRKNN